MLETPLSHSAEALALTPHLGVDTDVHAVASTAAGPTLLVLSRYSSTQPEIQLRPNRNTALEAAFFRCGRREFAGNQPPQKGPPSKSRRASELGGADFDEFRPERSTTSEMNGLKLVQAIDPPAIDIAGCPGCIQRTRKQSSQPLRVFRGRL